MTDPTTTPKSSGSVRDFLNMHAIRELFSLHHDEANRFDVIEDVRQNVAFRGTNLWILIFATIICSVGLNVNSTAVIIGAMLISPLMGPIVGLGVGSGTYDMKLIRRSGKNLLIAVVFSISASALYFFISPLNQAQSELLARTSPNLWDVIIALFGGLAGIIAATRKEKSNVVPGVAIATALMPPLCTAGYGIATWNWHFVLGAMYLFFINTVFISFSAWLMVRFMRFPVFDFVDAKREANVRRLVTAIVLLTTIPSCFYAYSLVNAQIFETRAENFINQEFNIDNTHVIDQEIQPTGEFKRIDVWLLGDRLDEKVEERIHASLDQYKLEGAKLRIFQGTQQENNIDMNEVGKQVFEDLYTKSEQRVQEQNDRIAELESELAAISANRLPLKNIVQEAKAAYPGLTEFTMNKNLLYHTERLAPDTALVTLVKFDRRIRDAEKSRFADWVKVRTMMDSVIVVVRQ